MAKNVYVKDLAVGIAKNIPENYAFYKEDEQLDQPIPAISVPVIDFSLLRSGSLEERSRVVNDLGKACKEWGFFTVVNHGVSQTLMKEIIEQCIQFFGLKDEMKKYEGKDVLDMIRCGTSYHPAAEQVHLWRDFLKIIVHPEFHSPANPVGFSQVAREYCDQTRGVATLLIQAIFESLGMDEEDVKRATNIERCNQIMVANYYPPCPQPHLALGLPPHSDHGLLTLLIHNEVSGFQLFREGNWLAVNTIPNSFLVNIADQLEIITNGKYKSVLHRAVVNAEKMRFSVALVHGPSLETIVKPSPKLLIDDDDESLYEELSYVEYLRKQQSSQLHGKSGLDMVRVTKEFAKEELALPGNLGGKYREEARTLTNALRA